MIFSGGLFTAFSSRFLSHTHLPLGSLHDGWDAGGRCRRRRRPRGPATEDGGEGSDEEEA